MSVLLRLVRRLAPQWPKVGVVIVVMLTGTITATIIPTYVGRLVDRLAAETPPTTTALFAGCAGLIGLAAVRGLMQFVQTSTAGRVGQRALFEIRNHLYAHLQYLPFSFFDKAQTGQLLSRVTADVESLRQFFGWGFVSLLTQLFTITFVTVMAFTINSRLAALTMATVPLLIFATVRLSRAVRPAFQQVQQEIATMNTVLQENLSGIRVVKAFTQEAMQSGLFGRTSGGFLEAHLRVVRRRALYTPAIDFTAGLGMVGVLWYGGYLVMIGSLTAGELIAFSIYLMMLLQPVRMLGFQVSNIERAIAAGARIFDIMDTVPEIRDAPDAIELDRPRGDVRFEGVSFAYGNRLPVLTDVSLDVPNGTTVALVGMAGSGKTSLVNLVPRFYDPSAGRVLLDGVDLRQIRVANLRQQVGIVPQDPFIFSATIRENIGFGREGATPVEIERAAQAAQIHDFIVTLPEGYDTVVGERGIGLSGGQRQRVAIARALLTDPAILILDDSLSSVDTQTERRIQHALTDALAGRTAFVIAHRLSTVRSADLVVVLQDGRIVQQGVHNELLRQSGPYREIVAAQLHEAEDSQEVV